MNTSNLKKYAPAARTAFIEAVTQRAQLFGISNNNIAEATITGEVMMINGKPFEANLKRARDKLVQRVNAIGFEPLMDQMAYTWFNRLCAIRYMELHDYLGHGLRVLSHPTNPNNLEILEQAQDVAEELGLDRTHIMELKVAGNQDEQLYRELLVGQCRQLHKAMPFLFETINDETELLLPTNLTRTDSMIRQLVDEIPEQEWQQVEIIGWLYQFYISEKKDEVIGKVVKSEDIPAATQLFTPNWIVKYMVQNSLGAQWLATYPDSPIKGEMEYYIEPAEQTDEVNAQLAAITPSSLDPEKLTLIDPACGSGHILVEAYELFKAIYLERGYRQRDIPQLILEHNLIGLDIDQRAAQLTSFALMMKGRADDRRLFERGVVLNVMALVDSTDFDADELAQMVSLSDYGLKSGDLSALKRLFEHATTFGSLIQVPEGLASSLPALKQLSEAASQDLFVSDALKRLGPLVRQAELLVGQYDAVVANPPYMGSKGMNALVTKFAKDHFPDAKSDLFACFIERGYALSRVSGDTAMVTMQSWMFLSSFEKMRARMLREKTVRSMAHLGARAFGSISGEVVQTTAFVLRNRSLRGFRPAFVRLLDGGEESKRTTLASGEMRFDSTSQEDFQRIPGSPVAYWASRRFLQVFSENPKFEAVAPTRKGMVTARNHVYVRAWHEVSREKSGLDKISDRTMARTSKLKWFSYLKGGGYRKWYGNKSEVVNWENDGVALQTTKHPTEDRVWATNFNLEYIFRPNVNWGAVTSTEFTARASAGGEIFDAGGSACFPSGVSEPFILAFLNSKVTNASLSVLNPTLNFQAGNIADLPLVQDLDTPEVRETVEHIANTHETDWNAYERSWDFQFLPILTASNDPTPTLESSYTAWIESNRDTITEMKRLEEENNRLFIAAYGLQDELTPDVPIEQITLTVNPAYRYGGKLTDEEQWTRFREDTMKELVSYAIGCMMGRYSLDAPGLIYAHSGNEGFDPSRYPSFPADDDGIIPLTDLEWFSDDATHRLVEFIGIAWDKSHLDENLAFLANNLAPKRNESNQQTIRRYLSDKFYKDHLQSYKKRPIYWLFSSGKQKAFQCLVYLHRYNEGTLARMRTEYVTPLTGKLESYTEQLQNQIDAAASTAESNRLTKELAALEKKRIELREFDAKLKHYADRRIDLDLDDGVKVNYGKFGDLLAGSSSFGVD